MRRAVDDAQGDHQGGLGVREPLAVTGGSGVAKRVSNVGPRSGRGLRLGRSSEGALMGRAAAASTHWRLETHRRDMLLHALSLRLAQIAKREHHAQNQILHRAAS